MPRAKPSWEQPQHTIVTRWREGDVTLAELECGHVEPVTGRDLFTWARCQQCNPVMKPADAFGRPGAA